MLRLNELSKYSMQKKLTEKDIKILKYEKRIGYVFSGLILCFGGLFNLIYFILTKVNPEYLMVGLINLSFVSLSLFVCYSINKKVNLDLQKNTKQLIPFNIVEKIEEKSYEAGSGAMFIPILGNLFPKLWGQEMRESMKYYIVSEKQKHEVEKEVYDYCKKGDIIFVHTAVHSLTVLIFSKSA